MGGLLSVTSWAQAVTKHRLRRRSLPASLLPLPTILLALPTFAVALAAASPSFAIPPCSESGSGWCLARRIRGEVPIGELGFRFGSPLDVDGDGVADIAAGARFKLSQGVLQNGIATVWSGASGAKIREWDGTLAKGLFGHWVMPIPDLDGDALADVIVSAPSAEIENETHGVLSARSPKSGDVIWRRIAAREEVLGWDMDLAGDQNGDGKVDLFAGAPGGEGGGHVYLVSGKDGAILRTYEPATPHPSFGWYVASTDDFDADGHRDLVVGNLQAGLADDVPPSEVFLLSAVQGTVLQRWTEQDKHRAFGEVVAGIGDLDGDGHGEIAIASSRTAYPINPQPGDVQIFSGIGGKELRRWTGKQPGERYGRMVTSAGDVDGDGIDDVAVGAPHHQVGDMPKAGRAEVRSGKTGAVLAEWFGEEANSWFGWHIRRAPDPDGKGRPALLIGTLMHSVGGQPRVGVLDLYVLRPDK